MKVKYVYFGKRPTNVCYNGVSFPMMPGDVIECEPDFAATYFREGEYKPTAGTSKDSQAPRHSFGRKTLVFRKDPTGGLPMTSSSTPPSKKAQDKVYEGPVQNMNPYDLGIDQEPKLEVSTFKNISHGEQIKPLELDVPTVEEVEEAVANEEIAEDLAEPEEPREDIRVPNKSELRKMTKLEIFNQVLQVQQDGASLRPEMAEIFGDFSESTTRGPMFEALWKYFGHDGE